MSAGALHARQARAADTGMWLFIASLVMFFGSLFSGYVLLRMGSHEWTTPWIGPRQAWELLPRPWTQTVLLGIAVVMARRMPGRAPDTRAGRSVGAAAASALGVAFVVAWGLSASALQGAGTGPATSVAAGSWFVLTGTVAVLVLAGSLATTWLGRRHREGGSPDHVARQLVRYWWLMLAFHLTVVIGMDLL